MSDYQPRGSVLDSQLNSTNFSGKDESASYAPIIADECQRMRRSEFQYYWSDSAGYELKRADELYVIVIVYWTM